MKKIYLFRHGQTDYNVRELCQGMNVDEPLNETGLEQAKCNAEFLKDFRIQHVYTSPLKRAYITGKTLADKINVGLEILEDLLPFDGGCTDGKPYSIVKDILGEDGCKKFHSEDGLDIVILDSECRRDLRNRTIKAIDYICKNRRYDVVGVSTHGDNLKELFYHLKFEDVSRPGNCEVVEAEYDGKDFRIIRRIKGSL